MSTTNYEKHSNQNPIQRLLINNFYKSFIAIFPNSHIEKILDVGCGEGFTLNKLSTEKIGLKLVGIDYSREAIELGKKAYPSLNLKIGDIYGLEERNESYDVVIATEVLEHLVNPQSAIKELIRVSKRYLVLSVPNEPFFILANFLRGKYLKNFGNHPEHINHWSSRGFERFLKRNGLKIVEKRHPFAWTLILAEK